MTVGVNIALFVFGLMVSVAVFAGIIAAISAVVGFSKSGNNEED